MNKIPFATRHVSIPAALLGLGCFAFTAGASLFSFTGSMSELVKGAVQALEVGQDFQGLVLDSSGTAEFLSRFISTQKLAFVTKLEIVPKRGQHLIQNYTPPDGSNFADVKVLAQEVRIERAEKTYVLSYLISPLVLLRAFGIGFVACISSTLLLLLVSERNRRKAELTVAQALSSLSTQVAHDIRSPLSTLDVLLADLSFFPAKEKVLARAAIDRIQEIANDLLDRQRLRRSELALDLVSFSSLIALVDAIVQEKRIQYKSRSTLSFFFEPVPASHYGFVRISTAELRRVLSNLLNNSAEAVNSGDVRVNLDLNNYGVSISVSDLGAGIPKHILAQLGRHQVSSGKRGADSGSGLGVLHAHEAVARWGGRLEIESEEGRGTNVRITLPAVEEADGATPGEIVLLDNDLSMHVLWSMSARRFGKRFSCFESWNKMLGSIDSISKDASFYIDLELGSGQSGIDVAAELYKRGFKNLYLETGRAESEIVLPAWIKGIVGKAPPWV